jgi:molybdopterin-synthase adenylyltransferase
MSGDLARYHRQMLLPGIGEHGQRRLGESHALLIGCGALGCVIADALVRAGVGMLTIIDRDVVELTNLQRQILFTERDADEAAPKAIAAQHRLEGINSQVRIIAHVDDFSPRNAERYAEGANVILDGLDNFETRYLLNDLAVSRSVPYIYAGAVGTTAMSFPIIPDETPCLRCIFPDPPAPGATATCDTAGVLGPAVMMIAAHQAAQAIKILSGNIDAVDRSMLSLDLWLNEVRRFDVSAARNRQANFKSACRCCGERQFEFLEGRAASAGAAVSLCGRNAVQINAPESETQIDLTALETRLAPHGSFTRTAHLLRGRFTHERGDQPENGPIELMLFPNGRAIIRGTGRIEHARSIYARYIGA